MARKKKTVIERKDNFIQEQPITQTLEQNYMPYAMSVIVSRAIPEIDGFKPSHRKLLYTMYHMGLFTRRTHKIHQCSWSNYETESPWGCCYL